MVVEVVAALVVVVVILVILVKALVLLDAMAASWDTTASLEEVLEQWSQVLVAGRTGSWLFTKPGCAVWQAGWQQLHWLLRCPHLHLHPP